MWGVNVGKREPDYGFAATAAAGAAAGVDEGAQDEDAENIFVKMHDMSTPIPKR